VPHCTLFPHPTCTLNLIHLVKLKEVYPSSTGRNILQAHRAMWQSSTLRDHCVGFPAGIVPNQLNNSWVILTEHIIEPTTDGTLCLDVFGRSRLRNPLQYTDRGFTLTASPDSTRKNRVTGLTRPKLACIWSHKMQRID